MKVNGNLKFKFNLYHNTPVSLESLKIFENKTTLFHDAF